MFDKSKINNSFNNKRKKIKIITDIAVKNKIDQKIWDEIIFDFTKNVNNNGFVEALKNTIMATSDILENYFPATGELKQNELRDDIIIE